LEGQWCLDFSVDLTTDGPRHSEQPSAAYTFTKEVGYWSVGESEQRRKVLNPERGCNFPYELSAYRAGFNEQSAYAVKRCIAAQDGYSGGGN
jgi:hypothetical protein